MAGICLIMTNKSYGIFQYNLDYIALREMYVTVGLSNIGI